ncbi:MAG: MG2 domain-containing protein [Candidatus Amulumruptor caecigallinarius]|nr:MG2 domain-containing protein [Candidatus Amulumruptor caecigallinarius]
MKILTVNKGRHISFLLLLIANFTVMGFADVKKEKTPDFAFPAQVSSHAGKAFKEAVERNNGLDAMKYAVQANIARNLIASKDFTRGIADFNIIADKFPAPWRNLAYLAQANIYSSVYRSDSYTYNNRVIPATPIPENVQEWSTPMFTDKVMELLHKAFSDMTVVEKMPLKEISPILADYDAHDLENLYVSDFMTLNAMELLTPCLPEYTAEIIPFGNDKPHTNSVVSFCEKILNKAIANHENTPSRVLSDLMLSKYDFLNRVGQNEAADKFLQSCLDKMIDTPYGAGILTAWVENKLRRGNALSDNSEFSSDNNESIERICLGKLKNYSERFPNAFNIAVVKNKIAYMLNRNISVNFPSMALPGQEIPVNVSAKNIYNFNLLVFSLPEKNAVTDCNYANVRKHGQLKHVLPVASGNATPEEFKDTLRLPALDAGYYVILPSISANVDGLICTNEKNSVRVMNVSDLSYFTLDAADNSPKSLYIVSARNQQPCRGVTVNFESLSGKNKGSVISKVTDTSGYVEVPEGNFRFRAVSNGSVVRDDVWNYTHGSVATKPEMLASVFSSLSVYHPGDTVRYSAVVYQQNDNEQHVAKLFPLKMLMKDANGKTVGSAEHVTDNMGRVWGEMQIPETGLLGTYMLQLADSTKHVISSQNIEVAEYKSPTFMVDVSMPAEEIAVGSPIVIRGLVRTYSGMPVINGKVAYKIDYMPGWWRRIAGGNASYAGETVTDGAGNFELSLETGNLQGTRFEKGKYRLSVTVTNAAGESQEADDKYFALGSAYEIVPDIPNEITVTEKPAEFPVRVLNMVGKPIVQKVYYSISNASGTVGRGEFESPTFKIDLSHFASGEYKLKFSLNDNNRESNNKADTAETLVVIYRKSDKKAPVQTPLWVFEKNIIVAKEQKSVDLKFASYYPDSYVMAVISDSNGESRSEWVEIKDGYATIKVDAPANNQRVFVSLLAMHDFVVKKETVTLMPECQMEKLKIETLTFRNNITPGDREQWKFRFTVNDEVAKDVASMAVMSNAALNAVAPFKWEFNPSAYLFWNNPLRVSFDNLYVKSNYGFFKPGKTYNVEPQGNPQWQLYSYSWYVPQYYVTGMVRRKLLTSGGNSNSRNEKEEVFECVETTSADYAAAKVSADLAKAEGEDMGGTAKSGQSDISYRQMEYPLAFFMPSLNTQNGELALEFEAPQFVGEWQFQLLGYTPDMKGDVIMLNAVSAKKVMVQMNAPRFMRTGDEVEISATLFNNDDATRPVSGVMEICSAATGEVIASSEFEAENLAPSMSRVVSMIWNVPSDLSEVVVRAYARLDGNSDGEQTNVAILPASAPVIDSKVFYISPSQSVYKFDIPDFAKNAQVTLSYCQNPVWECVTALPSIVVPKSINTLSQVSALYGNAMASGLFDKYPILIDALMRAASDTAGGALKSNLEKNFELKIVNLNNTPWVNNAECETLRMRSLLKYSDRKNADAAVADIVESLGKMQNPDGGFSWCPGMTSSEFITMRVISAFSMLKRAGFLPPEVESMAKKAVEYSDRQLVKEWKKSKYKNIPTSEMLNYIYFRSSFSGVKESSAFAGLKAEAYRNIKKSWKKFGIYDKALAASVFFRSGEKTLARTVLESLGEYASKSEERGMWFENLGFEYSGVSALIVTSKVLEAYAEISPAAPEIDLLRQWLLVSKQVQDWGSDNETSEVINAILTTGSDWIGSERMSEFYIDGKPLEVGGRDALTGAFTVDIANLRGARILEIVKKTDGPAWGGVISQYVAPISEVKAATVPMLSVNKNIYVENVADNSVVANAGGFSVGQRARVTLTIVTDRDIDYVVVSDPRPCCLEPAEQLSEYTVADGVWFYKEVRNTATNLFIPYLPKGTHVISYDCYFDRSGKYTDGSTVVQSQYEPLITAHSAGGIIKVSENKVSAFD